MLFVGPNDLCSSMGYPPPDHPNIPEVQDAIERIRKAAEAAGKYSGMFCTTPEQVSIPLALRRMTLILLFRF
jgi:4-hydroxy-2-oxoheptanedioate aldolase